MKTAPFSLLFLPTLTAAIFAVGLAMDCQFLNTASAQDSPAPAGEEVTVPTLEWVLSESDRGGLGNLRIRRLLAFVDSLDGAEIEPTIERLNAGQSYGRAFQARQMLYARWWQLDRDAVLKHLLALEGDAQHSGLASVLPIWAAQEPMKAWQWVEENRDDVRPVAVHSVLQEIAHRDPLLALKIFGESEAMQTTFSEMDSGPIYSAWANHDPAAAAAYLDASAIPSSERGSAMLSIAAAWIRKDADAAWRWAKSIASLEERHRAMEMAVSFLAINDLDRAAELLNDFPEGRARESAVSSLAVTSAMQDPEKAFAIVMKYGGANAEDMVLGRWAIRDADKALEIAKTQLPVGPRQQQAFNQIIREVARRDVEQAIEILKSFGPASHLTQAADSIARVLAEQDMDKARKWAESLPDGEIKDAALSEVVSQWLGENAEDAANYALARAAEDPSKNLLRSTLSRWGYQDPKACALWIVDHLDKTDQRGHLPSAVGSWAEHEPQAASEWTVALPEGDVRDECIGRLGSQWGYYHPVDGAKWLAGLVEGKARDQAIANYANRAFEYVPETVLEWCAKITDEKQRERTLQQHVSRYLESQPEQAHKWLESSSLSAEEKKSLLGD